MIGLMFYSGRVPCFSTWKTKLNRSPATHDASYNCHESLGAQVTVMYILARKSAMKTIKDELNLNRQQLVSLISCPPPNQGTDANCCIKWRTRDKWNLGIIHSDHKPNYWQGEFKPWAWREKKEAKPIHRKQWVWTWSRQDQNPISPGQMRRSLNASTEL